MAGMGALPELYFPHSPIKGHILGSRNEMELFNHEGLMEKIQHSYKDI